MKKFLPYGRQCLDDADIEAVCDTLRSPYLTTGPAVEAFEQALCEATGAKYAVVCSSGTAALHMAAMTLGLGPGDAVIVPAITFLATANAVRLCGAEVVFADVHPKTGLMTRQTVEEAVAWAKRNHPDWTLKAIFPVHFAGQTVNLPELAQYAHANDMVVVDDACHALGSAYQDGAFLVGGGDHALMSCFSFHAVKTVAMGEGGAVTTNDPELARRLRGLRSHGMTRDEGDFTLTNAAFSSDGTPNPWFYEMHHVGFNYRASDIHCALGASQMRKLAGFVERRAQIVARYDAALAGLGSSVLDPLERVDCQAAWHLYVVMIDFDAIGKERAVVMHELRERGVGTQVHYIPVSSQPYYAERYGALSMPGAESYYDRALSLPLFPDMSDGDVDDVMDALRSVLKI